nr:efflux RND transporter periplasmic adaptor subunit [Xanthomonas massiliensis]
MTSPFRTLALACAVALAVAACKKQEQPAPPTPEVGVVTATPQALPLQRELVGRLSPYRSADVRARVAGVLLKRLYEEGSDVKEGQVLFQIDPAPLQAALASAQGQLAAAQAEYTNAKVAADRARSLAPQAYVSRADLDTAEATERSSAASVKQARAAVDTAQINLGYARVTSPIAGRAGKQQVTEGALVGSSEATLLTTVDQLDPLYVNFSMSSDELAALRRAQSQGQITLEGDGKASIQVSLPDGSAYPQPGVLDFADATVDPSTGAVSLRALLPNPDHVLLPGSFVSFKATLGERKSAYLVPQEALQRDTVGAYLLVVGKDGKVVRRNVELDGQQQDKWLVGAGLQPGDEVIVSGLQKVKEGEPAKATPWQPQAQPGQAAQPAADQTEQN